MINNVALNGVAIWNYFFDNVTILPKPLRCHRCGRKIHIGFGYGNTKPSSPDSLPRFYMCKRCHQDWQKTFHVEIITYPITGPNKPEQMWHDFMAKAKVRVDFT